MQPLWSRRGERKRCVSLSILWDRDAGKAEHRKECPEKGKCAPRKKTAAAVASAESDEKLLNPAGEYAVKFAENHGISVDEAMREPMVKARFAAYAVGGI